MKIDLLKTREKVASYCEEAMKREAVGYDTETTALSPHDGEVRLAQIAQTEEDVGIIDIRDFPDPAVNPDLQAFRDLLESRKTVKVSHNSKFDQKWSMKHFGVYEVVAPFCTMLASQLLSFGDRQKRHNLAAASERFLGEEVSKEEQTSDWSADELSESQLRYAAKDAALMLPLREAQKNGLALYELEEVARIEFQAVAPVASMELAGFYLDREMWQQLLENTIEKQKQEARELQTMLSPGVLQTGLFGAVEVDLGSPAVILDTLQRMGIPVNAINKKELEPLYDTYPVLKKITEYNAVQTLTNAYGETMYKYINGNTGRVHSDFRQIGAPTGRFSSNNPNLQKIPAKKEYRSCFRAPEGKKLVIADFSQVELRILAHITNDPKFIAGFNSGRDFHTETAAMIFKQAYEEVSAENRGFAKRVNFGIAYGISKFRFSAMTGLSLDKSDDIIRQWLRTFRSVDRWLELHGREVIKLGYAKTMSGRRADYKFDPEDFGQVSAAKREGNNMTVQGSSADITKIALRKCFDAYKGTSARLVNVVHDEIETECDVSEAEEIKIKKEFAMKAAGRVYVTRVEITADAKIADCWEK